MQELSSRMRWLAFAVLCLGDLMIVLDTTIVNVALPVIQENLKFTAASLVWVVNAYLLTFGGLLLLGGRLADLYGQRRFFLIGVAAFTLASLACGLAPTRETLVIARAVQGVGGAVVSAVTLSLIMILFPEGPGRVRAMAYFGFVMSAGGSIGVLLGGALTQLLDWRSIFLVNLPIGVAVLFLGVRLVPKVPTQPRTGPLDIAGAATITAALFLAVYAVVGAEQAGWSSAATLGMLTLAAVLVAVFVAIEARTRAPLVPLRLFKLRNLVLANVVGVFWAAAMFAWFFLSALYMQKVLGYGQMEVGLGFLPPDLIMAAFSFKLSEVIVNRFGIRLPLAGGLIVAAIGLLLFSFAPVDGNYWIHILPAMLLLGIGAGVAFNPALLAAMNDVEEHESGLASGVVNTSFMMGGSLGLAVLASLAALATAKGVSLGQTEPQALTAGFNLAFLAGAGFAALAAVIALFMTSKPVREGAVAH